MLKKCTDTYLPSGGGELGSLGPHSTMLPIEPLLLANLLAGTFVSFVQALEIILQKLCGKNTFVTGEVCGGGALHE